MLLTFDCNENHVEYHRAKFGRLRLPGLQPCLQRTCVRLACVDEANAAYWCLGLKRKNLPANSGNKGCFFSNNGCAFKPPFSMYQGRKPAFPGRGDFFRVGSPFPMK